MFNALILGFSCVFILIIFVLTLGCCLIALTMKLDKRRNISCTGRKSKRSSYGFNSYQLRRPQTDLSDIFEVSNEGTSTARNESLIDKPSSQRKFPRASTI